ncbi:hypothetical protein M404DRAFT_761504 [Pisolithus tinctorius Marx 270]|uniref:Uncharacterized protein n=1 Tax=Pisolithus tinctorius Marx 270 TaxID=870435 RepID=A0A0C3IUI3_PISTI|nr:hypothetical protein M404DRAFT_761504 [Pisolithus tinctorius Marx 270]
MLCDMIQQYYYEWGEQSGQAKGMKVVLFFSFSTETMPEEIIYRRAMVTMTTTTVATMTMTRLTTDRWPHNARVAVRWIQGMVETNDELNSSRSRVYFRICYSHLHYPSKGEYLQ